MGRKIGGPKTSTSETPTAVIPVIAKSTITVPVPKLNTIMEKRDEYERDLQQKRKEADRLLKGTLRSYLRAKAKEKLVTALSDADEAMVNARSAWAKGTPSEIATAEADLGAALGRLGDAISALSKLGG